MKLLAAARARALNKKRYPVLGYVPNDNPRHVGLAILLQLAECVTDIYPVYQVFNQNRPADTIDELKTGYRKLVLSAMSVCGLAGLDSEELVRALMTRFPKDDRDLVSMAGQFMLAVGACQKWTSALLNDEWNGHEGQARKSVGSQGMLMVLYALGCASKVTDPFALLYSAFEPVPA